MVLTARKLPYRIIWARDYMLKITNEGQITLLKSFVKDLRDSLGAETEIVDLSFDTVWQNNPPMEAQDQSLIEYMEDVGCIPIKKNQVG